MVACLGQSIREQVLGLRKSGITAYLANHHDNEAVLNKFVVSDGLSLVIHDFAIDDQFLSVSGLTVSRLDECLESSDLEYKVYNHCE